MTTWKNKLYYGDNLDVLSRYIEKESVDLVYLDPPFKSNQDYNILFAEHDGARSAAQIKAFKDTWEWDQEAAATFQELVERGGKISETMQAFKMLVGASDMLAYLSMMAARLIELHRVLKPTGSIYLHCDPTASHYLKMLLDAIFGPKNFRNEIIWLRSTSTGSSKARARQYPRAHDSILFYVKSADWVWNNPAVPYKEKYLKRFKWNDGDERGFYRKNVLATYSTETFERLKAEGKIIEPEKKGGLYSYKQYLSESKGASPLDDTWIDIFPINPMAKEKLGYPTQKPEALLERIIQASSNEGDIVLDPFCGCGTAVAVAQRLKRRWIGIDITHLAIALVKKRLIDSFAETIKDQFDIVGEPVSLPDAKALAQQNRFQFQYWALGLADARPEPQQQKKGADKGIDGRIYFYDEEVSQAKKAQSVIFQVKSGKSGPADVRDLRGVIEREGAAIGVLLLLDEPTKPMRTEAAEAGFYLSGLSNKKYPRLQILTIEELLAGQQISYPRGGYNPTFKKAPKAKKGQQEDFL